MHLNRGIWFYQLNDFVRYIIMLVLVKYLHFTCESLNEPLHDLHLRCRLYFMNYIASRDVT